MGNALRHLPFTRLAPPPIRPHGAKVMCAPLVGQQRVNEYDREADEAAGEDQ